jgi:hypothetical protein
MSAVPPAGDVNIRGIRDFYNRMTGSNVDSRPTSRYVDVIVREKHAIMTTATRRHYTEKVNRSSSTFEVPPGGSHPTRHFIAKENTKDFIEKSRGLSKNGCVSSNIGQTERVYGIWPRVNLVAMPKR